jgi:excisionase family DNA binding protein
MSGQESRRNRGSQPKHHLLTINAVAERLVVSPRTVSRWIASGILPVYRIAGVVRVSEENLRAFLVSHKDDDE